MAEIVFNALVTTASVLFAYLAARRLGGNRDRLRRPGSLGRTDLHLPVVAVPYSDTVGMIFPSVLLYLYVPRTVGEPRGPPGRALGRHGLRRRPRLPDQAHPHLRPRRGRPGHPPRRPVPGRLRRTLLNGTLVLASVAVGLFIGTTTVDRAITGVGLTPGSVADAQNFPVTHFLKMGAQRKPGNFNDYYGAYSAPDIASTLALPPGHDRFYGNLRMYRERVAAMGPVGYLGFLNEKADWTFGDGSFIAYGEGLMTADPRRSSPRTARAGTLQRWFGLPRRPLRSGSSTSGRSLWLLTLLLCAAPLFLRRSVARRARPRRWRGSALLMLLALPAAVRGPRPLPPTSDLPYFVVLACPVRSTPWRPGSPCAGGRRRPRRRTEEPGGVRLPV